MSVWSWGRGGRKVEDSGRGEGGEIGESSRVLIDHSTNEWSTDGAISGTLKQF